jgi:hypothetical protein
MKYNFNGKMINIPDDEIAKAMKNLDLTKEQAIEMWLEDEGYLDNAEQIALCQVAKDNRITQVIHGTHEKPRKKSEKPKTIKISPEKLLLFIQIQEMLEENYENVEILKENKLISVETNGKVLKIDLIEQRKAKK